ncbi:hypothetical protein N7450_003930 [Penicillium hetheringtonii]|uniref:CFEM domain-containing protein n=1 Tax=Penicillium hetheringtonii TaxID=911720 RepID=A0AAD6DP16_9EURO|nr:hypothetical protein N7450_003930 [Penicillium hetheringtonii]
MKGLTLISLFTINALAHPSGLWWGTDTCYPSPENTDNKCLEPQKAGFDWSELANGDNWTFEGFNFVGFSPRNTCGSSGGKCIVGKLSRDDNYMLGVDAVDAPFSVSSFHLSTSRKTDVLINYKMADGSSCRQMALGRDIYNHQCGGATSVKFMLPEESKFGECDLNIHEINFDCSDGPKTPDFPRPSPSSSILSSHFIRPSTTITSIPSPTSYYYVEPTTDTWKTVETIAVECGSDAFPCISHSTESINSAYTLSTSSPSHPGSVSTFTHTFSAATSNEPSSHPAPPSCPNLVPKCINTWLAIPHCTSNSDAACFCPSSEFTERVESCIKAWGSSQHEISSALSYFAGICAPYVPNNPAIIEIVPPSTTSTSTTRSTGYPSHTTSTGYRGETDLVTSTPKVPETTVIWSSTTMVCPNVGFTTFTHGKTTSVALVATSSLPPSPSSTSHVVTTTSSSTTMAPCKTHHTFTSRPVPKETAAVDFTGSGSRVTMGDYCLYSAMLLVSILVY